MTVLNLIELGTIQVQEVTLLMTLFILSSIFVPSVSCIPFLTKLWQQTFLLFI